MSYKGFKVGNDPDALELPQKAAPGSSTVYPLDPRIWAKPGCRTCEGCGIIVYRSGMVGQAPCGCSIKRIQKARKETGLCVECRAPAKHLCGFCGGRHCPPHKERRDHGSAVIMAVYGRGAWSASCQAKNVLSPSEAALLVKLGTEAWDVVPVDSSWYLAVTYKLVADEGGRPLWLMEKTLGDGVPYQVVDWVRRHGERSGLPRLRDVPGGMGYPRRKQVADSVAS